MYVKICTGEIYISFDEEGDLVVVVDAKKFHVPMTRDSICILIQEALDALKKKG